MSDFFNKAQLLETVDLLHRLEAYYLRKALGESQRLFKEVNRGDIPLDVELPHFHLKSANAASTLAHRLRLELEDDKGIGNNLINLLCGGETNAYDDNPPEENME